MNSATVMTMTYEAMVLAFLMAVPLLATTLIVGLTVSIFQAATQINEMTLAFIPKLLAVGIVLILLGPWLIGQMVDYIQGLFTSIPTMVS